MPIQKLILAGLCFCTILSAYGQSFNTFESLIKKADSAYNTKNYSLSAKYYDEISQLPSIQKNTTDYLYDAACVYSLNKEKEKAISYLAKSFFVVNSKTHKNPVSALHITTDTDLDFISQETDFKNLIKKYYPGIPFEVAFADEISYDNLLSLINYYSNEPEIPSVFRTYEPVIITDKVIFYKKEGESYDFNKYSLSLPNFDALKRKGLIFKNCSFKLNLIWTTQGHREENHQSFPFYQLEFLSCVFHGKFFLDNIDFINPPQLIESTLPKELYLRCNIDPTGIDPNMINQFELDRCSVSWAHVFLTSKTPIRISVNENISTDSSDFFIHCSSVLNAEIVKNKFDKKNLGFSFGEINNISIQENTFNNMVILDTNFKSEFIFERTDLFGKLLLGHTSITNESSNDIDWTVLKGSKLAILKDNFAGVIWWLNPDEGNFKAFRLVKSEYISGDNDKNISSAQSFRELLGLYSTFLNLYKNKNDIESYNGCFVEIKELQSKRLDYLYESNKSFKTFFRWKLSQLLKFYVNYGTDPALAIVISLYIIFWFGVFFFFFPSDWDTTSKKNLIQNFKDFIQKNEKGYVVPFFVLIGGFALSLINALTLSLNAFITLGFGNIPTHGLARYVCVIEGFLGWFLLSIFTVALINQVL